MSQSLMQAYQQSASAAITEAECLPLAVYHDVSVYEAEVTHSFHADWVFLCAENRLENVGDYYALNLAGEPIAVVRGKDGELRALSNVCRHRGTPLLDDGFGQLSKNIVCPYHAWTFSDSGQFIGAPLTGEVKVETEKHCLPQFHTAIWNGLVFVNLADAPQPFSEKVAGLDDYLAMFDLARFKHSYQLPSEHWHSNWKLAVENGIESYHLFKVHKETLEPMTPSKQAYYVAGSSEWALTGGQMKDTRGTLSKWLMGSYPEAYNHYLLLFLPPSLIAVITYDGFNWIQILPEDPEHCAVIPGGLLEHKVKDFSGPEFQFTEAFLSEDKEICERVQRGMHARKGKGGKLVSLEQILVDFRQYLANRLFGTEPEPFRQTAEAERFSSE